MPSFRKKPAVVEAFPVKDILGFEHCESGGPPWVRRAWFTRAFERRGHEVLVATLEGTMVARPGDWIIRGIRGELYPCKPDIFAATYEETPCPPDEAKA